MKELSHNLHTVPERIARALDFDTLDTAASSAAMYLQYDDIVTARNEIGQKIVNTWVFNSEKTFTPGKQELTEGTLVFTTQAAFEAGELMPNHKDDIAYFWSEVGTAIIGQEVEIFTRSEIETHSLTKEPHPQKKRSDRDKFHRLFENRLYDLNANRDRYSFQNSDELKSAAD